MSKQKASAKEPFLPFFVGDFGAATSEWEGEAVSLYATLLLHQWALGTIPADPKKLCKLVRWEWDLFHTHWRCVRRKFRQVRGLNEYGEEDDRLSNDRLEEHRKKTQQLSEKNSASGSKGAEARWGKEGERQAPSKASAKHKDGERHPENGERHDESIAGATDEDGERHVNEMAQRHPKIDGVTDGNPSHPIPSHPDPSHPTTSPPGTNCNSDTSQVRKRSSRTDDRKVARRKSRDSNRGTRVPIPFVITDDLLEFAKAEAPDVDLKKATVEFQDFWKAEPGKRGRKCDWPATWRVRMRVLQDRAEERRAPGTRAAMSRRRTPIEEEWARLRDEGASEGFRQPNAGEAMDDYRAALKVHVDAQNAKVIKRHAEFADGLKSLTVMPK